MRDIHDHIRLSRVVWECILIHAGFRRSTKLDGNAIGWRGFVVPKSYFIRLAPSDALVTERVLYGTSDRHL